MLPSTARVSALRNLMSVLGLVLDAQISARLRDSGGEFLGNVSLQEIISQVVVGAQTPPLNLID